MAAPGQIVCMGCGCLCDDIGLAADFRNACELGEKWLAIKPDTQPEALVNCQAVSLDEAIAAAARILTLSHAPLIIGLRQSTIETARQAVALADLLGAVIDSSSRFDRDRHLGFSRVGTVGATLGEVKSRADLVVFLGVNPEQTHPRHLERYASEPAGRFLDGPRKTLRIGLPSTGAALAILSSLRALLRGKTLDSRRVAASTGLGLDDLKSWLERMTQATYGALFYGSDLDAAALESLMLLVRELNEKTRFVMIGLGSSGNPAGIEAVMTWQAGYPSSVDFASGVPRSIPRETSASHRLSRGEFDAILQVGPCDLPIPPTIPRIVIGPDPSNKKNAEVVIRTSISGIETGGTIARVDGVMLPLRPYRLSEWKSETEILEQIIMRLERPRVEASRQS